MQPRLLALPMTSNGIRGATFSRPGRSTVSAHRSRAHPCSLHRAISTLSPHPLDEPRLPVARFRTLASHDAPGNCSAPRGLQPPVGCSVESRSRKGAWLLHRRHISTSISSPSRARLGIAFDSRVYREYRFACCANWSYLYNLTRIHGECGAAERLIIHQLQRNRS